MKAETVLKQVRERVEQYGLNGESFPVDQIEEIAYCPRGLIMAICDEADRDPFIDPEDKGGYEALRALDNASEQTSGPIDEGEEGYLGAKAEEEAWGIGKIKDLEERQQRAMEFIDRAISLTGV